MEIEEYALDVGILSRSQGATNESLVAIVDAHRRMYQTLY